MAQGTLTHGVMEGNGAYNLHARLPANGAALAIPALERAVEKMALEAGDGPIVIADYGSSQGKNSLAPMEVAIRGLRARLGPDRSISIFHIDQPSNDFNSLFGVLSSDPDRYTRDDANVFPHAIGRSFYEPVLPPDSVGLAWSSYAAVWLSCVPSPIPGHIFPSRALGAVRNAYARQAAEDWENFLSLRATEMREGARLVVVLPALLEHISPGFTELLDHANDALAEMVRDGAITAEERNRMVLASYPRTKKELLAPFAETGQFRGLVVEECEVFPAKSPGWEEYEADRDAELLARKQALFFRAVFTPSLAAALTLTAEGDAGAAARFADRLQESMVRRLARRPARMESYVQAMVMAKYQ
jgi:hypothetical protein